ncbi:MAG: hypothetical protein J5699_09460, partial [Bacteroidales bacterium]|nr:hypothetical protein [Bacteroidales bacterium]
ISLDLGASYCISETQTAIYQTPQLIRASGNAFEQKEDWALGVGLAGESALFNEVATWFYDLKNNQWIDKNLEIRTFKDTGNQFIGGRNSWAKATSNTLRKIGNGFGAIGIAHDTYLLLHGVIQGAPSEDIIVHSVDLFMDGVGFIPVAGPWISFSYSLLREPIREHIIIPTYEAIVH